MNTELIEEMKQEINNDNIQEVKVIANEIQENICYDIVKANRGESKVETK